MKKSAKKSKMSSKKLRKYLKQLAKQPAVAVPPLPSAGGDQTPMVGAMENEAVPSSSTLLAYKLLKDSSGGNSAVFEDMLQNELKYLYGGISLLKNDPKISSAMGGETMANAARLASIIKAKSKELDFNDRIENIASDILYHDYSKPGKRGMMPGNIPPSVLRRTANGTDLHFRAAGATGHQVAVNAGGANVPAIRQVPLLANAGVLPALNGAGAINAQFAAQGAIVDANGYVRQRRGNPLTGFRY